MICSYYLLSIFTLHCLSLSYISLDLLKQFHTWLSGQKDIVRECSDYSGDISVVERKLQKLKVQLFQVIHYISHVLVQTIRIL